MVFDSRADLLRHKVDQHLDTVTNTDFQPPFPWMKSDGSVDENMRLTLVSNRHFIFQNHRFDNLRSEFHFELVNAIDWYQSLHQSLDIVKRAVNSAVKINISMGYLLKNKQTGAYRYFVSGSNFPLFKYPIRIDRPHHWTKVSENLNMDFITSEIHKTRPDTKWALFMVTNAVIEVFHLGVVMGCGDVDNHVKVSQSIRSLTHDSNKRKFSDNLCAVRALAFHQLSKNDPFSHKPPLEVRDLELETLTRSLSQQWNQLLTPENIPDFEDKFDIDVDVYCLEKGDVVRPIYLSEGTRGLNKMFLNLNHDHASYVTNFRAYARKFQCDGCGRHFELLSHLRRHQGTCTQATLKRFHFDHYQPTKTIFECLELERVSVHPSLRLYPWFATYDCEAALISVPPKEGSTRWTKEHRLVSISVASNVKKYKNPVCFKGSDPDKIMMDALLYLEKIRNEAKSLARTRWDNVFISLNKELNQLHDSMNEAERNACVDRLISEKSNEPEKLMADLDCSFDDERNVDYCDENDNVTGSENSTEMTSKDKRLKKLLGRFTDYCDTLPVIGFNSSNYDLNLMRPYLFPKLGLFAKQTENEDDSKQIDAKNHDDPLKWSFPFDSFAFNIKKASSYTTVKANSFKFLDILQFQAVGVSYSKFLKSFDVQENKSFFPYEWLDSVEKLNYSKLPPYEAFFSKLKGINVLEEGGDHALGQQRYRELNRLWRENKWTSIGDYLEYYNNLDVGPFVTAIERMQKFYFDKHIDLFKCPISIPGISRQLLFREAAKENVSFASILIDDEDLYYTFKRNIFGGPSIVFRRKHIAGKTLLHDKKLCSSILGFDANGLYVYCIDQEMPCGGYVRRLEPDFKPVPRLYRQNMFDWMDFLALKTGNRIQHARNGGEVWMGEFRVDGFCSETNTVYEMDGCLFHGCQYCHAVENKVENEKKMKTTIERRSRIEAEFRVTVVHIQECQYKRLCKSDSELFQFCESRLPPFYRFHRYGGRTEETILKAVQSGNLSGMVEVDIEVPQHLWHHFSEMSPLFATVDVSFNDIGTHMQQFVQDFQRSQKIKRLLVGGMKAEKILVHSKLLQWCLTHGLVVKKIYQVIEFLPLRCFRTFVEEVTQARRQGDVDSSKKPIADSWKLISNSAYGSLVMDKTKHNTIQYISSYGKAQSSINNPRFQTLNEVRTGLYEIKMSKKHVDIDLPIQLGYSILQFAKLRMLEFFYDFLKVKCEPNSFEMMQMDTDSLYFAASGPDLRSIIKPELRDQFDHEILGHCNDEPYTPDQGFFFPRECCPKHAKFDSRTPGLFKLEAKGVEMICLNSKTYSLLSDDGSVKFSSKGLNKRALSDPHHEMLSVLDSKISVEGTNRGIRVHHNKVMNYEQERKALTYEYWKRKVNDDGITTSPLTNCLKIWPDQDIEVVTSVHPLYPDKSMNINLRGATYHSLLDVCMAAEKLDDQENFLMEAFR